MKHTTCYLSVMALISFYFLTGCEKKESEPEPTASFTPSKTAAEVGENITFTNNSLNATTYEWDFDDGTTSTAENPTHAFSESGIFTVELTAKGAGGTHSTTKDISIEDPEPVADFTPSKTSAYVGETITFTNQSLNASTYAWDFGDGGSSTIQNPTHVYNTAGTFTVVLTATGPGGENSTSKNITITHAPPVAGFTMSHTTAEAGTLISFTNTSVNATSYYWDFGDGGTSTSANPTHTYISAGDYTITLEAEGPGGLDDESKSITITAKQENLILPGDRAGIFILGDNMGVHDAKLPPQSKQHIYIGLGNGSYLHWYRYLTTGIGFWVVNNSPNLYLSDIPDDIMCEQPFNGITDKGIKWGSTFTQVVAAYGPPNSISSSYGTHYYDDLGIVFYANTAKTNVEDISVVVPSSKKSTRSINLSEIERLLHNGGFVKGSTEIHK